MALYMRRLVIPANHGNSLPDVFDKCPNNPEYALLRNARVTRDPLAIVSSSRNRTDAGAALPIGVAEPVSRGSAVGMPRLSQLFEAVPKVYTFSSRRSRETGRELKT